jgi:Ca-activated chloride channel family protein
MRFAYPELRLLVIAVIPLLIVLFVAASRRRRGWTEALGTPAALAAHVRRSSGAWVTLRRIALVVGVTLLGLAAARPQSALDWVSVEQSGIDVVVALDLSLSMSAEDLKPSRIARAKQDVRDLLQRLDGDRVALVVFAGEAIVQSPLTVDYSAIRLLLEVVEPGMLPTPGTAIAAVLDRSLACFPEEDHSQARAVLLISDGEDHEGDVDAAISRVRDAGVRVYALGMGRAEGEPIPVAETGEQATFGGYKSDREGKVVMTRLDEGVLRRVASETGGAYVPVSEGTAGVDYVADLISDLEEKAFEAGMFRLYEDRFMVFLAPALLLLMLEFLVGDRARRQS